MNNYDYFMQYVKQKFPEGFCFKYSSFKDGQFGDLQRVEFGSPSKIGEVDFWSTGWLNISLVDIGKDEDLLNLLLDPDEASKAEEKFEQLVELLSGP